MKPFATGHATHPQWAVAAALVLTQLRAQTGAESGAGLGVIYMTDALAPHARDVLDHFMAALPEVTDWVGASGVGIAATGVEYFDEPALAVMLLDLPADQVRVFSGVSPLPVSAASGGGRFSAATALVHADADTPDLADLLTELAERTTSGQVFGGLSSGRGPAVQLAHSSRGTVAGQGASAGVFQGGLSGVALGPEVGWVSRVTQGCVAVSPRRTVTAAEGHLVLELDGRAALDVLLDDLGVDLDRPQPAIEKVRQTLVGLAEPAGPGRRDGGFGAETRVRHIVGLDPVRQAVAVADRVVCGQTLTFCERSAAAAQADLMRLCAEIREEQEALACAALADERWPPQPLAAPLLGALYISCAGRGGPHFGAPHAELQVVRRALGDVPLVGFFAGGEIAGRQLYAYTGVLTVFLAPGVAGR